MEEKTALTVYVLWFVLIAIIFPSYKISQNVKASIDGVDSLEIVQHEIIKDLNNIIEVCDQDTTLQFDQ